jgi:hypothetical protein
LAGLDGVLGTEDGEVIAEIQDERLILAKPVDVAEGGADSSDGRNAVLVFQTGLAPERPLAAGRVHAPDADIQVVLLEVAVVSPHVRRVGIRLQKSEAKLI